MIGQQIREFEILSELGSGGYGVVYRARDTSVDRDVAIKVILPQFANTPEFVANFEAEARLVAQLEHKDIVPLYAYWRDDSGAYLVMRHIRGGNLRGILNKQGILPLNKTVSIIEQVANALHAAHESGVVHRDLKPDNILIDERGNAYLTDFGIAKNLSNGNDSETDSIKGTFAYLSPEQIMQTAVSPHTDIYALGIMLYEMLAGKHPYHDVPIAMMVLKHMQEPVPDIRDLRSDLNDNFNDIIQRATAKDPHDRYSTTLDLIADLKTAVSGTRQTTEVQKALPDKKKVSTLEERNRAAMIQNVRSFWIEGVLESSLYDTVLLDLGMKSEAGAVNNPWDTLLRTPHGDESLIDQAIITVFDRMNGKLLILGDPGGGKTTTLLMLAQELLFRAEFDDQHPIPVVFNLSSWSEKQLPLAEWIVEELTEKYQVPHKVGKVWVENDELLLLLDGLDEVRAEHREACVKAINFYRSEHGFVDIVVCSRLKDYESLSEQLRLNGAIIIQPLDDQQIMRYLDALGPDVKVVREIIIRDSQFRELAKSPLMLSIMVLAFRGKTAADLPDFANTEAQRQYLFEVYVDRMINRRGSENLYRKQVTVNYLQWIARRLVENGQTLLYLENLQPSWLAADQYHQYKRLSKATFILIYIIVYFVFHLFFTPLVTIAANDAGIEFNPILLWITGTIAGLILGINVAYNLFYTWLGAVMASIVIGTAIFVITGFNSTAIFLSLGFAGMALLLFRIGGRYYRSLTAGSDEESIVVLENATWSPQNVRPVAFIFGILVGLIGTVSLALAFSAWQTPESILISAVLLSITISGMTSFFDGLRFNTLDIRQQSNQGIWNSLSIANRVFFVQVVFSLLFVPLAISFFMPLSASIAGVMFSIIYFFFGSWMIFGGITVIKHLVLRYVISRSDDVPFNLARFLDYAASIILLRKVGGGYIFIHRYLLEYFAESAGKDGSG